MFGYKKVLTEHIDNVHGIKDRRCLQCNKFFTEKGLVHHEKIVHNRTLNCSVCDKAFGKKSGLEHHIKMVHGEKNHKCALCNDAFPTVSQMKSHMEHMHDMTKPFKCSICSKTFNTKERLEHHFARTHELRNCEPCPHCNKQYSRLKAHLETCSAIRTQAERKRFKCPNCGKFYVDKSSLNKHIKNTCTMNTQSSD